MPLPTINRMEPDHIVSLAAMPSLVNGLIRQSRQATVPASDLLDLEAEIARTGDSSMEDRDRIAWRSTSLKRLERLTSAPDLDAADG